MWLDAGDPARDFRLESPGGGALDSLEARRRGLLLLAFWKRTCGTCRLAFPFLQRFHDAYAGARFQIWGIAQETAEETALFVRELGVSFPQALDTDLEVTELYDIPSVPHLYLLDASPVILQRVHGFSAEEYNGLSKRIADALGLPPTPIVREEDAVPAYKPG